VCESWQDSGNPSCQLAGVRTATVRQSTGLLLPVISEITNSTRKTTSTIFAISMEIPATPMSPSRPTTIAMIKKVNTKLNMALPSCLLSTPRPFLQTGTLLPIIRACKLRYEFVVALCFPQCQLVPDPARTPGWSMPILSPLTSWG
jgi:hypothetical protein